MIHTVTTEQHDARRLHQIASFLWSLDDHTRHAVLDCFSPEEQARILASATAECATECQSSDPLIETLIHQLQGRNVATMDLTAEDGQAPAESALPSVDEDWSHGSPDDWTPIHPDPIAHLLAQSDPSELAVFLQHEHPQLIAAVLGLCEVAQAHAILESLKLPLRDDVRQRWLQRRELQSDIATELRCELLNQLAHRSQRTDSTCRNSDHA